MNFLAHIYLSGDSPERMIGNFIADFIQGNQYKHYSEKIIEGILLHRQIDSYTDSHSVVKQSIRRLQPDFGKYAGVVVDIFYDHFLAVNWSDYAAPDLDQFSKKTYQILEENKSVLPEQVQDFLPYMVSNNWLLNYSKLYGIEKALEGLSRRIAYRVNLQQAVENLQADYHLFQEDFGAFFPEIQEFVKNFLEEKEAGKNPAIS